VEARICMSRYDRTTSKWSTYACNMTLSNSVESTASIEGSKCERLIGGTR
jgi:hypothetical protein